MMQTIKGIYRDGRVELLEPTQSIAEGGEVTITYKLAASTSHTSVEDLKDGDETSPFVMRFGMFANTDGREASTDEDFKLAEFHADADDGLD